MKASIMLLSCWAEVIREGSNRGGGYWVAEMGCDRRDGAEMGGWVEEEKVGGWRRKRWVGGGGKGGLWQLAWWACGEEGGCLKKNHFSFLQL
ncbi:unnamed protein product [Prunus armeniaca]|uniref:Uncharacterized protein n=1 Tax=Prunus armeniaca TaxID=36596 RepID=A0A6J5WF89_PRUAR|nr:unnamed protein product [Prunus armeniaca]CAB4299061.1 unnamed protein product [Prunus armeniaca]